MVFSFIPGVLEGIDWTARLVWTPCRYFPHGPRARQFARVYIPLRRRVTASIPGLRVLVHSNPLPPIVSRLRKAVLSRIIRLHRIIAYNGRDRRTPAARLHLFRPAVHRSKRAGDLWQDWYTRRKWVARDWKSIRFSNAAGVCVSRRCNVFSVRHSASLICGCFFSLCVHAQCQTQGVWWILDFLFFITSS